MIYMLGDVIMRRANMKTNIYALVCPIDKQIVYIGKANCCERRLKDHIKDQRNISLDKMLWLDKLKTAKLKPELLILDSDIPVDNWQFWEEFYIGYYKSLGIKLLNKRSGNGLTYANSQTFRKGQRPKNYGKKLINGHYE